MRFTPKTQQRARRRVRMALVSTLLVSLLAVPGGVSAQPAPPTTEFEDNGGADWTSEAGEQSFLAQVAASPRVELAQIGTTDQGRPIQLVTIGAPSPADPATTLQRPSVYFTCSVHGDEPAGREACLITLRDLAFATDNATLDLLSRATVLFTPTANPDGRAADSRGNASGADINRDHLNLRQAESRAIAAVIRDLQPDVVLDLHEYGGTPVVYDDDVTLLWPRNVNVDDGVYDLAVELVHDHLMPGLEARGFTADEYGIQSVGDFDLAQTAGGSDEGILRNVGGLRHSVGILVESSAVPRLLNPLDPGDLVDMGRSRRVASQVATIEEALEFLAARGEEAMAVTAGSRQRKLEEGRERSAPIYFDGQRQDSTITGTGPPPSEEGTVDPPPCGYRLTAEQLAHVRPTMNLLGIGIQPATGRDVFVPMAQESEPLIPLLLDSRGARNQFTGADTTWQGGPGDVPRVVEQCPDAPSPRVVRRIQGPDRAATAAAAAEASRVEADVAVIATTADYADALAGTVLAKRRDAVLLLSEPGGLSQPAADEITRRGISSAVLLGGTAALSAQVVTDLEALGLAVSRIAGQNRFDTAGLVFDELGGGDQVTIAEGEHAQVMRGWPDAVSSAALSQPILLVNADRLPEETASRITGAQVRIVGGPSSVSEAVEAQIAARVSTVERVAGDSRYETSLAVRERQSLGFTGTPPDMWLASGRDWPEALVAAANAVQMLLIDGVDLAGSPQTREFLRLNPDVYGTVNLVGTPEQITPEVEQDLRDLFDTL